MVYVEYSCKNLVYPFLSSSFYFLVAYILRINKPFFSSLYKNDKGYQRMIRSIGAIYNLIMTCFSFIIFYSLSKALISEYGTMFNHNVWFRKQVIENTYILDICWMVCHSKTLEYVDTFFVLLEGGRPICLQKFNHFGPVWSWSLLLYVDSASVLIATLYNSLVHTFMYFYYFLSVFDKDKILLPFKPVMTSLQHLQLAYGFYAILFDYVIKHYEGTILDAYTIPNLISLFYGLCLNLLFLHFSFVNYLSQKKSERPKHS